MRPGEEAAVATVHALHPPRAVHRPVSRWLQVAGSAAGMTALAGILFVWPLLRAAPGAELAEALAATENAFAAFVIAESLFVPLEAWLGDRLPRLLLAGAGAALVGVGALGGAAAHSALGQVAWSALGGVGAGLAYGATMAKALRRFTDRKALCAGVTAAACAGTLALGLGALLALTATADALPILVALGAAQALVIVVATLFILYPAEGTPPSEW